MPILRNRIESILQDSGKASCSPLERILFGLSRCYGAAVTRRNRSFQENPGKIKALPCRVISVGNLVVGGTGKTPMTLYLAKLLQAWGYRVVIISRGYGGKTSAKGGIVSDGRSVLLNADMAGDEPHMMAARLPGVPVIIGRERYTAGRQAVERFGPDVILLDDGFQHRRLHRDLDILLLDEERPFGNGHLLPRGILREPIGGLSRAGIIVLTRSRIQTDPKPYLQQMLNQHSCKVDIGPIPMFQAGHEPYLSRLVPPQPETADSPAPHNRPDPSQLVGKPVFAFSGIAQNQTFHGSVRQLGCRLVGVLAYPDHHDYKQSDLETIVRKAAGSEAERIVTTEKDYARIKGKISWPLPLAVIDISLIVHENHTFHERVKNIIL